MKIKQRSKNYDIALVNNSLEQRTVKVSVYRGKTSEKGEADPYKQKEYIIEGNNNPNPSDKPTFIRDDIPVPGKGKHEVVVAVESEEPLDNIYNESKLFETEGEKFPENEQFSFYIFPETFLEKFRFRHIREFKLDKTNFS